MKFCYRGITADLTQEMVDSIRESNGIDLPLLLQTSINRMLLIEGKDFGVMKIAVEILNPDCSRDECVFHIRVFDCKKREIVI